MEIQSSRASNMEIRLKMEIQTSSQISILPRIKNGNSILASKMKMEIETRIFPWIK